MLKRFVAMGLSLVLLAGTVAGCGDSGAKVSGQETDNDVDPTAYVQTLEAKYNPQAESVAIPHYGSDDKVKEKKEIPEYLRAEIPALDPLPEYFGETALAYVNNYVNVRTGPTTEDEVVGKIYNFCAAKILDTVDGEDGKWYLIASGTVVGYIKSEFFLIGEEAEAMLPEVGVLVGTVNEDYLRVRSAPDLSDPTNVFTYYERGTEVFIDELTEDGWAKITSDDASTGFVYAECLDINYQFKTAISLEEEAAEIARREAAEEAARKAQEELEAALLAQQQAEEEARQKEEEAKRAQEEWEQQQLAWQQEQQRIAQEQAAAEAWQQEQARIAAEQAAAAAAAAAAASQDAGNDALAAQRNAVVSYALQFVGNPYVHGGRSLVTGTDCSGFTSLVYQNFGYYLSYTPEGQSGQGVRVDINDLRPGDLLFYSNSIKYLGHVAMYIGNGQIVHAGTEATGIEVRSAFYRQPLFANRIIN